MLPIRMDIFTVSNDRPQKTPTTNGVTCMVRISGRRIPPGILSSILHDDKNLIFSFAAFQLLNNAGF